ncbi:MAG: tetraacyldisaccharide 4'-kinase [Candidatus Omnitrophica bacterium]|nr:tetraacyldisaccharide 4'-kinase [Candidatus Omnitrophota bacterium]
MALKQYIQDLMNDKKSDPLSQIIKLCLLISSYIYGVLAISHHFFYKVNLLKSYKSKISVISVGNITLGGTGKTPFVIMLAKELTRKKRSVAVLIRGYGEDEWKLLEDRLAEDAVKVLVGRDRVKSARKAETLGVNSLVLDDGFQHRRLRRDLDIVLVDSTNAFGNKHLFPRGILREPVAGLKRADVIVLTKMDKGKDRAPLVESEIKKIAPGKPVIKTVHKPKNLFDIARGEIKELSFINKRNVCMISAICDPTYFRHTINHTGAGVKLEFVFPDHYPYKREDLDNIFKACRKKGINTVITTEKDAVKLKKFSPSKSGCQILALGVELEIIEGKEVLDDVLSRLYMRDSRKNT